MLSVCRASVSPVNGFGASLPALAQRTWLCLLERAVGRPCPTEQTPQVWAVSPRFLEWAAAHSLLYLRLFLPPSPTRPGASWEKEAKVQGGGKDSDLWGVPWGPWRHGKGKPRP